MLASWANPSKKIIPTNIIRIVFFHDMLLALNYVGYCWLLEDQPLKANNPKKYIIGTVFFHDMLLALSCVACYEVTLQYVRGN